MPGRLFNVAALLTLLVSDLIHCTPLATPTPLGSSAPSVRNNTQAPENPLSFLFSSGNSFNFTGGLNSTNLTVSISLGGNVSVYSSSNDTHIISLPVIIDSDGIELLMPDLSDLTNATDSSATSSSDEDANLQKRQTFWITVDDGVDGNSDDDDDDETDDDSNGSIQKRDGQLNIEKLEQFFKTHQFNHTRHMGGPSGVRIIPVHQ